MIEVTTLAICDRCGAEDIRDGDVGDTPPVEWSTLTLAIRLLDTYDRLMITLLCPKCSAAVGTFAAKDHRIQT